MQTKDLIISGLIGGLISIVLYPIIAFFSKRLFIYWGLKIKIENSDNLKSLRITNNSFYTLKNVVVYVSINNDIADIITKPNFKVFSNEQVFEDRLSWSKNVDGKNKSDIDINQGESQKLNVLNIQDGFIEVASEQGFYSGENSSRILLRPNRNYSLDIKITGDNFFAKKDTIHYHYLSKQLNF